MQNRRKTTFMSCKDGTRFIFVMEFPASGGNMIYLCFSFSFLLFFFSSHFICLARARKRVQRHKLNVFENRREKERKHC